MALKGDSKSDELTVDDRIENRQRINWKTESEQQIYSSKLIQALTRETLPLRLLAVKETADRVLAVRANGTTRWSRAILKSRFRLKNHTRKLRRVKKASAIGGKPAAQRSFGILGKKVRVLSRLVPGCRKLSFPELVEEATDYISALEMQVRALTDLFAGAGEGFPMVAIKRQE